MFRRGRRLLGSIERVEDQNRIAGPGKPRRHLLGSRSQAKDIRPGEYGGMLALRRADEVGIAGAVWSFNFYVHSLRLCSVRQSRQGHCKTGPQRQSTKLAPRNGLL